MMYTEKQIKSFRFQMVGSRYRHFKGGVYIVTDIAVHTETGELMIIYKSVDDPDKIWCRPLDMFISNVDTDKYPDVTHQVKRFTPIRDGKVISSQVE